MRKCTFYESPMQPVKAVLFWLHSEHYFWKGIPHTVSCECCFWHSWNLLVLSHFFKKLPHSFALSAGESQTPLIAIVRAPLVWAWHISWKILRIHVSQLLKNYPWRSVFKGRDRWSIWCCSCQHSAAPSQLGQATSSTSLENFSQKQKQEHSPDCEKVY